MIKNIYKAETQYTKKNIFVIFFMIISALVGWGMISLVVGSSKEPINNKLLFEFIMAGYMIIAILIPFQMSNYFCSNFETGSIKNILASGHSRVSFVIVKFLKEASILLKFLACYFLGATLLFIIKTIPRNDFNLLDYLNLFVSYEFFSKFILLYALIISFSSVILFVSMIFQKVYIGTLATILILVADIMSAIFLPDTPNNKFFKTNLYFNKLLMSTNKGMQFMKEFIILDTPKSLVNALIVPLLIIVVFLSLSILVFSKKDVTV